ncbi:hypothetical protein EUTSA_v10027526mg [Eutrema salsugineum]|uniref:Defensin-like protein n=1 Tax=Eutrema salsugineum TaxID=72664 RepID=V4MMZ7_EUTSA|nr:defensin-like protein 171 [Eutrema salsugineum]ESQ54218.1 hypothetical protein EUTSA_v10027526mg [Eutrema salsugineum]
MAKAPSSLVFPIIFLVMFALVEQNMGCMDVIGTCRYIPDCGGACRVRFGINARGFCDRDGADGRCICAYPCPSDKTHS